MEATVIYHSADFDGIFCREIARKFLSDAELIGWNFGDAEIDPEPGSMIYILDLPPECVYHPEVRQNLIWIDHHKTSIEKWKGTDFQGYCIDGVAACRLAWQWFAGFVNKFGNDTPTKEDFIQRRVAEPWAVRLAGEYDIWDKRDPDAETFQYALRAVKKETLADMWPVLLSDDGTPLVADLLKCGAAAQTYAQETDASICKSRTWIMEWEGLRFLCLNSARFNSLSFAAKDLPETGHDALLGFCFNGTLWTVSLYHAKHRTDLDLSAIAKKYNGGGHRGACGFTCKTLPFCLSA